MDDSKGMVSFISREFAVEPGIPGAAPLGFCVDQQYCNVALAPPVLSMGDPGVTFAAKLPLAAAG
jgi:hypothetical protein